MTRGNLKTNVLGRIHISFASIGLNQKLKLKQGRFWKEKIMGHEHKIVCKICKQGVKKESETRTTISFKCPCGKKTYSRSKGL